MIQFIQITSVNNSTNLDYNKRLLYGGQVLSVTPSPSGTGIEVRFIDDTTTTISTLKSSEPYEDFTLRATDTLTPEQKNYCTRITVIQTLLLTLIKQS